MNFPGAGAAAGASGIDPNDPNMKKMAALMESCYAKTVMSGVMGFGLGGVFGLFMASMAYDTPYHTAAPAPTAAVTTATTTATGTAAAAAGKAALPTSLPSATTATSSIPKSTPIGAPSIATPIGAPSIATALPRPSPLAAATQAGALAAAQASVPISSLPLKQQLSIGFRDMGARSWSSAKNFGKVGALFSGIECGIEGLRAKNDIGNGVAAGCVTGGILARKAGPQAAALGCAGFAAFSAAIEAWMRSPSDE